MCGRYVAASPTSVLAAYFEVDEVAAPSEGPNYNVAPTDPVPAVAVASSGERRLGVYRWGLVPSWSTSATGAARLINARAETVLSKAAFRTAFARRRCLLPADGFYEWARPADGPKQPWFVHRADGAPLAMAGLWEIWRPPEGELLRTCSVITTSANELMAPIHDRMPVLIEPGQWATWLDRANDDVASLAALLAPADDRVLEAHRVSPLVNSVRNNGPELLDRVRESP
jgi:putative SOS response-associated peptidase YedK